MKVLSVFLLACALWLGATADAAATTPYKSVVEVSDRIQSLIDKERKRYASDPKKLEKQVYDVLEPVVDFDSIANAVMGKHAQNASEAQKNSFKAVFKDTLVALYTKVLVEFEAASIRLDDASNRDPGAATSASVNMVVTSKDNKVYNINYAMRKTGDSWKVRNIVADGINLGLTYRNQFESAMNRYKGNIDNVIANWTQEMENTEVTKKR